MTDFPNGPDFDLIELACWAALQALTVGFALLIGVGLGTIVGHLLVTVAQLLGVL